MCEAGRGSREPGSWDRRWAAAAGVEWSQGRAAGRREGVRRTLTKFHSVWRTGGAGGRGAAGGGVSRRRRHWSTHGRRAASCQQGAARSAGQVPRLQNPPIGLVSPDACLRKVYTGDASLPFTFTLSKNTMDAPRSWTKLQTSPTLSAVRERE